MSTPSIILLVAVFLVTDFIVVGAVIHSAGRTLREVCAAFPPTPRSADAVERRFQGFKFGMVSLGFSVHAAVDERALHLTPTRLARWIGMTPMSIPWAAFSKVKPSLGEMKAVVAGVEMAGPKWCMELAAVPAPKQADTPRDEG